MDVLAAVLVGASLGAPELAAGLRGSCLGLSGLLCLRLATTTTLLYFGLRRHAADGEEMALLVDGLVLSVSSLIVALPVVGMGAALAAILMRLG